MVQVSCCDRLSFTVFCIYALFTKKIKRILKSNKKLKKEKKTHIISLKTEVVGRPNCAANKTIFVCFYTFCWRLFFGAILSLSPLFHCTFSLNRHPNTIPHSVALSPLFFCAKANLNQKKKIKTKKKQSKKVTISPFPSPFSSLRKEKTNKQTSASTHTKSLNKSRQHQQYQRANKHTHKKDDVEHQAVHGNDSEPNKRVGLRQIQNSSAYPRKRSPSATVGLYGDDGDDERGSHNNNSSTVAVDWHGGGCERGNNKRGF